MNRKQQKKETREHILRTAKMLFKKNGVLNTSSKEISDNAGIAHGTLFFHFENVNNLVVEILDMELMKFTDELHTKLSGKSDIITLLEEYLDFLIREEAFFSVLARELPFYKEDLRRIVFFREAAVRKYFYQAIEEGIHVGIYRDVEISGTLTWLFGTINYLLANKNSFGFDGSIIRKNRNQLIDNFLNLINK